MGNNADLDTNEQDVLRELGHIGLGNAVTSMSYLLNCKLNMDFTKIYTMEYDDIMDMLGGPENMAVGVLSMFEGDINGMLMFVMQKEMADNLVNELLHTEEKIAMYDHMQASAVKETCNILSGSYLAALETMTGLKLRLQPPQICVDMAGAILSVPVIAFGQTGEKAFMVESGFDNEYDNMEGHLMMISDAASYQKMCNIFIPDKTR